MGDARKSRAGAMTEYLIVLSWPHKDLQSNARKHWVAKAKATKNYRCEAAFDAKKRLVQCSHDAELIFTFTPPDRRHRDLHNMPYAMKAVIDGIADAMGCDDKDFVVRWPTQFEKPTKPGSVLVHIKTHTVTLPVIGSIP